MNGVMNKSYESSSSVSRRVFTYSRVVGDGQCVEFGVYFGFMNCDYCWIEGCGKEGKFSYFVADSINIKLDYF